MLAGPDGEFMTPMQFLTWLHETGAPQTDAFYDVVLKNIECGAEGTPSADLVLQAVRRGNLDDFLPDDGWGCAWMELCALLPDPAARLEVAQAIAAKGLGPTLLSALGAGPRIREDIEEACAAGFTRTELRSSTWTGNFMSVWGPTDAGLPHFLDFSPEQRLQFLALADRETLHNSLVAWEADALLDPDFVVENPRRGPLEALQARRAYVLGAVRAALAE
jgi:hypothetical protein